MTALNKQARLVSSARISEIANGANLIMGEKEWLANTAIYLAHELKTATKAFQSTGFSLLEAEEKLEAAEKRIAEQREYYEGVIADGSRRIEELEAGQLTTASRDVLAERQRQISMEGWKPEHDDEHCNGELAMAAVCYINETGTVNRNGGKPWGWPWDASWWKPNSRRRNLVKAGALIIAEIERIDRAAGIGVKGE